LAKVAAGLSFDRACWQLLVGEMLLFAAADIPEIQTAPETLFFLLDGDSVGQDAMAREHWSAIRQAHYGAQDLRFGAKVYRQDSAGYNDLEEVARLADYLTNLDPAGWTSAGLRTLPGISEEEDRDEELEFARDCLFDLTGIYQAAHKDNQLVVCEIL
jgi:hypothetical protein